MERLSERLGDVLTTRQVAQRLGVSVAKVHRLIASGELKPVTRVDGQTGAYYFAAEDVERIAS